jgi:ribosomal protein S18 acetylase RimI-like enzyme
MLSGEFHLRQATPADAAVIRHHRRAMFHDMGMTDAGDLARMDAGFAVWLDERFAEGRYIGWFACTDAGTVAAGAGLWLLDWPPSPRYPHRTRGYLINVYTEPEHRRRGLARALVKVCMDDCANRDIGLMVLHASDEGRAVYEGLGFTASNEMRRFLESGP